MTTLSSSLPLYTPDTQILGSANTEKPANLRAHRDLDEVAFKELYEIDRTVEEIIAGGYTRVALQFPDELLGDSTRVYELVLDGINREAGPEPPAGAKENGDIAESEEEVDRNGGGNCATDTPPKPTHNGESGTPQTPPDTKACSCKAPLIPQTAASTALTTLASEPKKAFILADTSYSACCIDEIAAEHCAADVLVHYGRSCLSPTTRLPVIYVFTSNPLDLTHTANTFRATFPDKSQKVIIVADVTYSSHVAPLHKLLQEDGYTNVYPTDVIHNPSAQIPNRSLPPDFPAAEAVEAEGDERGGLKSYSLFHISPPLPSLLLVLTSRVYSIHTYDTTATPPTCSQETTLVLLRRRYALLSHARSANVIGILVNTLNVKNYLPVISMLKRQIRDAGRKSYLVVVGKVNVEKVANFAEVEVWVGVGCWEQGIVGGAGEGSGRGFFRGVVTPFELGIALSAKDGWGWTGRWVSDFESLLRIDEEVQQVAANGKVPDSKEEDGGDEEGEVEEDEDEPPEFDLRTGRYVSTSRPMRHLTKNSNPTITSSSALIYTSSSSKQLGGAIGGVVSPAAQFLKDSRSWRGLGSDLVIEYEENGGDGLGAVVEVGRSGVARGYTVGGEGERW
ncbi:diphthamide biosynthesis protein [Choiromyces venosus 120613-1]|uniref:2-(3-amino-3-carboxypropyl)histidine synthase subunit 2 n=1 Tax=Choiromyces venosus 120613-1 TaxID=1336337 RepID=A0A3N4JHZ5_9PEZI|nr:diphthamide biosynthesis protein [Choiromyces venosus 120613-1]